MNYYSSMQELIGHTPLVLLGNMGVKPGVNIFAKLELMNPSGSVKDRTAFYMLNDAERRGLIHRGGTIVEATAGNTGLGIAFAALNRGYKVIFVVPDKFSAEKQTLMRALGAEIVNTPRQYGMQGAVRKATEIRESIPGAISLGQFENQSNPLAHYETTGPEIYNDLEGRIDYVVAGAGSGGTYTGILRYLKEQNPAIRGILADPVGSTMGGGEHADYNIEGIGNDFIAATMDMQLVDEVIKINDTEAFAGSRLLARQEGIFAGSSSGAALSAALKLAARIDRGNIVVVLPDRGDRYFSTQLYDTVGDKQLTFTNNISLTLLIPLYMRALENRKAHPMLSDPLADRIISNISYDFSQLDAERKSGSCCVARARYYDDSVRKASAAHDEVVVVNVGCGLDTRFHRLQDLRNVQFYELDLPDVLDIRSQLIPENTENHMPFSMFDTSWMEQIRQNHPESHIIIIFEGVLMYYSEEQVRLLLNDITAHFPDGEVFFDMCDRNCLTGSLAILRDFKSRFKMGVDSGREIERIAPKLKLIEQRSNPVIGHDLNATWQMLQFKVV